MTASPCGVVRCLAWGVRQRLSDMCMEGNGEGEGEVEAGNAVNHKNELQYPMPLC